MPLFKRDLFNVIFFNLNCIKEELWLQGKSNVEREFDTLLNKFSDNLFSFEPDNDFNLEDSHIPTSKGSKYISLISTCE